MKIVDNFLKKIGTDKFLHFLVLALATAWASILGSSFMWGVLVLSPFIGAVKEMFDTKFDCKDIIAGVLGSVTSVIVYWIIQLILWI